MAKRIVVVPDTQIQPETDTNFLEAIGNYIVEKSPDVIIHMGDHWDMPSLSSYDVGKKQFEGRRYIKDIEAGNTAMDVLTNPIKQEMNRLRNNKKKVWQPEMYFLTGNHEQRIQRAVNADAKLEGVIGYKDLNLSDWKVYDFLEVLVVEDIAFSHYFVTGVAGRPASSAAAQLNKKHMSCVAGHKQGLDFACANKADGKRITSVIAGSSYPEGMEYLGPQGNNHWRGILVLHDCNEGEFDMMPVSTSFLLKKYL